MRRPTGVGGWVIVFAAVAVFACLVGSCPRPDDGARPLSEGHAHAGAAADCPLCKFSGPFTKEEADADLRARGLERPKGVPTSSEP